MFWAFNNFFSLKFFFSFFLRFLIFLNFQSLFSCLLFSFLFLLWLLYNFTKLLSTNFHHSLAPQRLLRAAAVAVVNPYCCSPTVLYRSIASFRRWSAEPVNRSNCRIRHRSQLLRSQRRRPRQSCHSPKYC